MAERKRERSGQNSVNWQAKGEKVDQATIWGEKKKKRGQSEHPCPTIFNSERRGRSHCDRGKRGGGILVIFGEKKKSACWRVISTEKRRAEKSLLSPFGFEGGGRGGKEPRGGKQ